MRNMPTCYEKSIEKLSPLIHYLDSLKTRAELGILAELLKSLHITAEDLAPFCIFEEHTYRRNAIKESSWYTLDLICWRSEQVSPIHDHGISSCSFKIIQGRAVEMQYVHLSNGYVRADVTKTYNEGDVCSTFEKDTHAIRAAHEDLVTLHVYSPPLMMCYYAEEPKAAGAKSPTSVESLRSH